MKTKQNDHDHDHDSYGNDNDNGNGANRAPVAAAAMGSTASTSLTSLAAVLSNVDVASVIGRSGMPMLQFKRDNNGTWSFGQKRTVIEEGSRWAVNPTTFKRGHVCFEGNKVLGERLVSVSQPMLNLAELPDKGVPWQEEWAVNLKCLDGADAGTEVIYKVTTVGGIQAVAGLIEAVRDRLNGGQHDDKVAPVVLLEKSSYLGPYGKIWTPLMTVVEWMALDGPAPTSPPPAEQPRRRRVVE